VEFGCSHKNQHTEVQNLKIHPKIENYSVYKDKYKRLDIKFSPSAHIFSGIGESFSNLDSLLIKDQSIKFVERSNFAG
jgi:hypothetical protein